MQIHLPIQPKTTFTLPTPAQAVACANGQIGPYFLANNMNKTIDMYMCQGDQLIAQCSAPYTQFNWYDITTTQQFVCSMTVNASGNKLYVLFGTKMPNNLYKAWVTQYTWNGETLQDSGYSFPIPGLTGLELTDISLNEVSSLDQTLTYVKDHGFTGISQQNTQLIDLLNIVYYRGALFVTYPIYFKTYPVVYTAVLVINEHDAAVRSASVLAGLSKWHEHNWPKPIAESVTVLDGIVAFRALRAGLLPRNWYEDSFSQYSRFVEFDPCFKGDINAWRQLYSVTTCPALYLLNLHSSITAPTMLTTSTIYSGSPIASTGYTDSVLDGSNTMYIGLTNLDLQTYSIEYIILEVLIRGNWVPYRTLDYQKLHPTQSTVLPCRIINTAQNTYIWNLVLTTTAGLTIGTTETSVDATSLTIVELEPQQTYTFFACFTAGCTKPTLGISYTPGI